MKKDLVSQLRYYCDCVDEDRCFHCQCADEIERLRIDINDLQNIIQLLKEAEND